MIYTPLIYRIALVVDVPNWAFAGIAQSLKTYLKCFDIAIIYSKEIPATDFTSFDLIHFFHYSLYNTFKKYHQKGRSKITIGVHGHHISDWDFSVERQKSLLSEADAISCVSKKLVDEYDFHNFVFYCPDGVDTNIFTQKTKISSNSKIIIGFSGNSKWGNGDYKGLNIIQEAVKNLHNVELKVADRNEKWRSQQEMVDFYNSIDIIICASLYEGTPLPLLESAACGRGCLTTDVGIARDFVVSGNGLLFERNCESLRSILKTLKKDIVIEFGKSAKMEVKHWDRQLISKNYYRMFSFLLNPQIHVSKDNIYTSYGGVAYGACMTVHETNNLGFTSYFLEANNKSIKLWNNNESFLLNNFDEAKDLLKNSIYFVHNWEYTVNDNTPHVLCLHQLCKNSINYGNYEWHNVLLNNQESKINEETNIILYNPALSRKAHEYYSNVTFHTAINGFDTQYEIKDIKRDIDVLYVGRLERFKGTDILLETAKQNPDINFMLIGRNLGKFEFPDNVTFIDKLKQSEVFSYYNRAKIFILPSLFESMPRVLLEAGYFKCCCITTDLLGFKEMFGDSFIYLDHLKPEGITGMLRLLLFQDTNHLKIKEMGEKAHSLIKTKYSKKQITIHFLQIVKKLYEEGYFDKKQN